MARPEDPDVFRSRLDAEAVQQSVIVVGRAVFAMYRDVQFVSAFDQIQMLDRESHLAVAVDTDRFHLFNRRIRSEAAHPVSIKYADTEDEISDRLRRTHAEADGHRIAGVKSK